MERGLEVAGLILKQVTGSLSLRDHGFALARGQVAGIDQRDH